MGGRAFEHALVVDHRHRASRLLGFFGERDDRDATICVLEQRGEGFEELRLCVGQHLCAPRSGALEELGRRSDVEADAETLRACPFAEGLYALGPLAETFLESGDRGRRNAEQGWKRLLERAPALVAACRRTGAIELVERIDLEEQRDCLELQAVDLKVGEVVSERLPDRPGDRHCSAGERIAQLTDDADDQTSAGGGWMLATERDIDKERSQHVTVVKSVSNRGGVDVRVYANAAGCGVTGQDPAYSVVLRDELKWTHLRARYVFAGSASCWWLFGSANGEQPVFASDANLLPFESSVDTATETVRMGGSAGDAFNGVPSRCGDGEPGTNFWDPVNGTALRSALVTLRRSSSSAPAGLATIAGCLPPATAGTSSPTYWEYREIYVR